MYCTTQRGLQPKRCSSSSVPTATLLPVLTRVLHWPKRKLVKAGKIAESYSFLLWRAAFLLALLPKLARSGVSFKSTKKGKHGTMLVGIRLQLGWLSHTINHTLTLWPMGMVKTCSDNKELCWGAVFPNLRLTQVLLWHKAHSKRSNCSSSTKQAYSAFSFIFSTGTQRTLGNCTSNPCSGQEPVTAHCLLIKYESNNEKFHVLQKHMIVKATTQETYELIKHLFRLKRLHFDNQKPDDHAFYWQVLSQPWTTDPTDMDTVSISVSDFTERTFHTKQKPAAHGNSCFLHTEEQSVAPYPAKKMSGCLSNISQAATAASNTSYKLTPHFHWNQWKEEGDKHSRGVCLRGTTKPSTLNNCGRTVWSVLKALNSPAQRNSICTKTQNMFDKSQWKHSVGRQSSQNEFSYTLPKAAKLASSSQLLKHAGQTLSSLHSYTTMLPTGQIQTLKPYSHLLPKRAVCRLVRQNWVVHHQDIQGKELSTAVFTS